MNENLCRMYPFKQSWRMTLEPHWKRKDPSVMCQNNTQSYGNQLAQMNTGALVKWAYRHDLTCVENGIQSTKQTLKQINKHVLCA